MSTAAGKDALASTTPLTELVVKPIRYEVSVLANDSRRLNVIRTQGGKWVVIMAPDDEWYSDGGYDADGYGVPLHRAHEFDDLDCALELARRIVSDEVQR